MFHFVRQPNNNTVNIVEERKAENIYNWAAETSEFFAYKITP